MIDDTNIQRRQLQYQQSVFVEASSETEIMYQHRVEAEHTVYVIKILCKQ